MGAVELPIQNFLASLLRDVKARIIVQQANVVELRVLLADLVGPFLQLGAVDLGSNCRVVRQQFETVQTLSPDLLLMEFTFHERIRHFIASAPRTIVGVVDIESPFFISSDNGVQPVESATSGEQVSRRLWRLLSLNACGSH
ncbi:hypothetical protein RB195_013411 [Necator americanus]|uniref:Uncharacterized protein n=1 Tax=Necator americanus TaxID=51031 RepID=A0ABR1DVF7_NECAM